MHRSPWLPLLAALVLHGCGQDEPAPFEGASDGRSSLTVEGGIAVLRLAGGPRERGAAHGRLLRDSIRAAFDRLRPAEPSMVPFAVDDCSGRLLRYVPPELRAELEGIAEGSGLTLNQVVFLNARFELAQFRLLGKGDGRQRLVQPAAVHPGPVVVRGIEPADLDGLADTLLPVPVSGTPDLSGLVWPLYLRLVLEEPGSFAPGLDLPAKPTLSASIPLTGPRTGLLQVAPPGATWYPSAGGFVVAGDAEVTGSEGRIEEGKSLPGTTVPMALPDRIVAKLEHTEEGIRVEFAHAGERKTRVLR